MNRNVALSILLLLILHFSLSSCNAFRPVSTAYHSYPSSTTARTKEPKEEDVLRQKVADYAQQFVGTKYKVAGKTPGGFDCSGFTGYVMSQFDIQLSASSKYQESDGKMIPVSEVQPGDLMFFRREKNGAVFHVSLVIANNENGITVVHSTSSRGVVIDNIQQSSYWREMYATACRVIRP
ncbi:MAG: C40 family peptidase [Saprospirales bacterium]|nr:C40 family peptidase [Saprospirales bacterium]